MTAALFAAGALPVVANDSNPGAYHTLYLDFGEFTSSTAWPNVEGQNHPPRSGGPITSPAMFDASSPENYTPAEKATYIHEVWRRVAEDFAPFDVNVTTNPPADIESRIDWGRALRVAIGGTINDIGYSGGVTKGYAYLLPQYQNVAFVVGRFTDQSLRPKDALASTIAHEAAHAYGTDYHYRTSGSCVAQPSDGLNNTHLTTNPGLVRDKWWKGLGAGYDIQQNSTCAMRGDVGRLWSAIGRRSSPIGASEVNPLRESSPNVLIGAGIVTNNIATHNYEEWLKLQHSCQTGNCDYQGIPLGYSIGTGPNEWRFVASPGGIEVRVNTINSGYLDRAANFDADFQLRVEGSVSTPWILLESTANRQTIDPLSAELTYEIPSTESEKEYVVSVRSREEYGDLGQYTIEVRGLDNNVREIVDAAPPKEPTFPDPPVLNPEDPEPGISPDPKRDDEVFYPVLIPPTVFPLDPRAFDTVQIAK